MKFIKRLIKWTLLFVGVVMVMGALSAPDPSETNRVAEATVAETTAPAAAEPAAAAAPAPVAEETYLRLTVNLLPLDRAFLLGETNLPDGMLVVTSVAAENASFFGQAEVEVVDGAFRAGPFGPVGGLPSSTYTATATTVLPRLQDAAMRAVIGQEGEKLSGPQVERGQLGVTVSAEQVFQVGSDAEAEAAPQEVLAEGQSILSQLRRLEERGRGMEPLRKSGDLAATRRCGDQMRAYQAEAKALRSQAGQLPVQLKVFLATAVAHMTPCVSCASRAVSQCDLAGEALQEAESVLQALR